MTQIPPQEVPVDHEVEYEVLPEHRPNPKVAVVVAGAALAVTLGLTILVIPYARQAANVKPPPQFISQRWGDRPLRSALPKPTEPPLHPELAEARTFNNREEARLFGRTVENEDGEEVEEGPVEPVSPWLGFQALAVATGIVGASTALGVYGAAKYLGVNTMEEFASKMRGGLAEAMPELVENVRRVAEDEHEMPRANVLDRYGHLDDDKLDSWLRNFEPQTAAERELAAAVEQARSEVHGAQAASKLREEPRRLV